MTSAQPREGHNSSRRQTLDAMGRFGYPDCWTGRLLHEAVPEIGQPNIGFFQGLTDPLERLPHPSPADFQNDDRTAIPQ